MVSWALEWPMGAFGRLFLFSPRWHARRETPPLGRLRRARFPGKSGTDQTKQALCHLWPVLGPYGTSTGENGLSPSNASWDQGGSNTASGIDAHSIHSKSHSKSTGINILIDTFRLVSQQIALNTKISRTLTASVTRGSPSGNYAIPPYYLRRRWRGTRRWLEHSRQAAALRKPRLR